jgi:hypothetical protein
MATIFVDNHSQLGHVHPQKDLTSNKTLRAKHAFDLYARERGVVVKHYYADSVKFVDNAWKNSLDKENQGITYCSINAHWQNGIVERRIRDLKEQTRTMLLYAEHHWPDAVTTSLWLYAMQTASHIFNDALTLKGAHKYKTPKEIFTGVRILEEVRHHHQFGCPAYVTANQLQAGNLLLAWMSRACVGINLRISLTHAQSVVLVLGLKTGLVSPQSHVKHNDLFKTSLNKLGGYQLPESYWQELLLGFVKGSLPVPRQGAAREDPGVTDPAQAGRQSQLARDPAAFIKKDDGESDKDDKPSDEQSEQHVQIEFGLSLPQLYQLCANMTAL